MPAMTGMVFDLKENSHEGFVQAVNNNQPALALQYLVNKLEEMEARLQKLEESEEQPVKKAPVKKTAAKKTTTKTEASSED